MGSFSCLSGVVTVTERSREISSVPISIEYAGHGFPLSHGPEPVQVNTKSGAVVAEWNEQISKG